MFGEFFSCFVRIAPLVCSALFQENKKEISVYQGECLSQKGSPYKSENMAEFQSKYFQNRTTNRTHQKYGVNTKKGKYGSGTFTKEKENTVF